MDYQRISISDWINQMLKRRTRPVQTQPIVKPTPQPEQPQQPVNPEIPQSGATLVQIEAAIHSQINQARAEQGLPALTLNADISNQARIHSQNMADGRVPFSHEGFQERARVIGTKIPYSSVSENVAYNNGYDDPASQAVQGWLKSPGHYTNIMSNSNLTGIGAVKNARGDYYFTQIFVRSR